MVQLHQSLGFTKTKNKSYAVQFTIVEIVIQSRKISLSDREEKMYLYVCI